MKDIFVLYFFYALFALGRQAYWLKQTS